MSKPSDQAISDAAKEAYQQEIDGFKSKAKYNVAWDRMENWLAKQGCEKLNEDWAIAYVNHLSKSQAGKTVKSTVAMLVKMGRTHGYEFSQWKRMKDIVNSKARKHEPKKRQTLTLEEIERFCAHPSTRLCEKLATLILWYTELRPHEWRQLTVDMFFMKPDLLTIEVPTAICKTSGGSFAIAKHENPSLCLLSTWQKYLSLWKEIKDPKHLWLLTKDEQLRNQPLGKNWLNDVLCDHVKTCLELSWTPTPYTFKHSGATHLAMKGATDVQLMGHLRHKTITASKAYIQQTDETKITVTSMLGKGKEAPKNEEVKSPTLEKKLPNDATVQFTNCTFNNCSINDGRKRRASALTNFLNARKKAASQPVTEQEFEAF